MIREVTGTGVEMEIPKSFGRYVYFKTIGCGASSTVIEAVNTKTGFHYAVKVVSRAYLTESGNFQDFEQELRIHQKLNHPNIVKIHDVIYQPALIFVVLDLCSGGDLLNYIMKHPQNHPTVHKRILYQVLSALAYIHERDIAHRDIKPDNFVMGIGNSATQVFIIDYGLAKKYRDQHTHMHIPYVEGKSLTGTARYASVGALRGVEQSRRDDLESLGFVWMYLLKGTLPWMGLNGRDQKQKYDRICDVKAKTSFEDLCRGFPNEFVRYFQIVRSLRFTEKPNYAELRQMFRDLFIREGFVYDYRKHLH